MSQFVIVIVLHLVSHSFLNDSSVVFSVTYVLFDILWWTEGPICGDPRLTRLHRQDAQVYHKQRETPTLYCPSSVEIRYRASSP